MIAGRMEDEFMTAIEAKHLERLMRNKLRELHYKAKASIGIAAGALVFS